VKKKRKYFGAAIDKRKIKENIQSTYGGRKKVRRFSVADDARNVVGSGCSGKTNLSAGFRQSGAESEVREAGLKLYQFTEPKALA
jgi:hypothetical protein